MDLRLAFAIANEDDPMWGPALKQAAMDIYSMYAGFLVKAPTWQNIVFAVYQNKSPELNKTVHDTLLALNLKKQDTPMEAFYKVVKTNGNLMDLAKYSFTQDEWKTIFGELGSGLGLDFADAMHYSDPYVDRVSKDIPESVRIMVRQVSKLGFKPYIA